MDWRNVNSMDFKLVQPRYGRMKQASTTTGIAKSPLAVRIREHSNKVCSPPVKRSLEKELECWIPANIPCSYAIKVSSVTPIGTIADVPTSNRKLRTPRYIKRETPKIREPPDMYLGINSYVNDIREAVLSIHGHYLTPYIPLPNVIGLVTTNIFKQVLDVYENNQVYYQDRLDTMPAEEIRYGLTELEHWFGTIIEPVGYETYGREERELHKFTKGYTAYCDPSLVQYITPFTKEFKDCIRVFHK